MTNEAKRMADTVVTNDMSTCGLCGQLFPDGRFYFMPGKATICAACMTALEHGRRTVDAKRMASEELAAVKALYSDLERAVGASDDAYYRNDTAGVRRAEQDAFKARLKLCAEVPALLAHIDALEAELRDTQQITFPRATVYDYNRAGVIAFKTDAIYVPAWRALAESRTPVSLRVVVHLDTPTDADLRRGRNQEHG